MSIPTSNIPPENTIDIWQIDTNNNKNNLSTLTATLDQFELERYQKFHHKFKHRYLLAHFACREILSSYLDLTAKDIVYIKNQHGKPELNHGQSFSFNMSHSHNMAVIAVSKSSKVGVDVEYLDRKPSWEKIAKRFFSKEEVKLLFKQPNNKQETTFFQIWTRKEAFIKALGTGFATPLSTFDTSITGTINRLDNTDTTDVWHAKDLELTANYLATVVQDTSIEEIRYYSYK